MNGSFARHVFLSKPSCAGLLWLFTLTATACSLKSLDYLENGEASGTAGATAMTGGSEGSGGKSSGQSGSSALMSSGSSASAGFGGLTSSVSGGTGASAGSAAGAGTSGGVAGGTSGITSSTLASGATATGGTSTTATTLTGGHPNSGGTTSLSSGGSASSGGLTAVLTSSGGIAGTGGAMINVTTGGSAGANTTGGKSALPSGGANTGGANTGGANTGGASTGGAPAMIYDVPGQSCAAGLTCPTSVSCCTQIAVPAGSFVMGTNTDPSRNSDESPPHTAIVDGFLMDKFEVTVGRFRNFYKIYDGTLPAVDAGKHPKVASSGWQVSYNANMPASKAALQNANNCNVGQYQTWTEVAGVHENFPMTCVSWYVAFAFCIWDGGRLPSEAEWEMAAADGTSQYRFPWGSPDPDPATNAVMNCLGDGVSGCSPSDILAVGSRPAGANKWGHLDLAGSMWEWTLDFYDATYYQAIGTCNNCINTANPTPRVIRGGNFLSTIAALRSTSRASKAPIAVDPYTGFRCVRSQ